MPKLRNISGKLCVKILCNKFEFSVARVRGSHCILVKYVNSVKIGTVVPLHPELKRGTLKGILFLAGISIEEFEKHT